jgi:hypothetical protein
MSKPNNLEFITNDNIEMLWDLILDTIGSNVKTNEQLSVSRGFFINQAKHFFEKEKYLKQNVMDMNKKFIAENIQNFQNLNKQIQEKELQNRKQQNMSNLNNGNVIKEFLTIEDLHTERLNQFEQSLEHKQKEFQNMINVPIPKMPNFKEDISKNKINTTEMQDVIAKTISERNFEFDNIKKTINDNTLTNKVKSHDNNNDNNNSSSQYQYANQIKPKFIKIGEELDLNKLDPSHIKKQITWGKNQEYSNEISLEIKEIKSNASPNIFSKLKKKVENNHFNYDSNALLDSTPIYSEDNNPMMEIQIMKEKLSSLENRMNELIDLFKNKIELNAKQNYINKYKDKDI